MRTLNFLIKPASSLCGLRCRYCFYADEAANRSQENMGLMTAETVDLLLSKTFQTIEAGGLVSFAFQGGEPTMVGIAWFREFVRKARRDCPKGVGLAFSIQTNGMTLDEEWAVFFREERFLVGLSMDGVKDNHNRWRLDAQGKGTWNRVVKALALLQKHRVEVNVLCVVTGACAKSPEKTYRELKKLGARYFQFIPCLDPLETERGSQPWSLPPKAYGDFLCRLFDLWYQDWEKGDYHSVRLFEDYVHQLLGGGGGTCSTCGQCGAYLVVEGDGSVYPCDFFALDQWRLGSLRENSLEELLTGEREKEFLAWGREKPAECLLCRWRILCNGGCKNDWLPGKPAHNAYCGAFRQFFSHAEKRLAVVARAEQMARRGR